MRGGPGPRSGRSGGAASHQQSSLVSVGTRIVPHNTKVHRSLTVGSPLGPPLLTTGSLPSRHWLPPSVRGSG